MAGSDALLWLVTELLLDSDHSAFHSCPPFTQKEMLSYSNSLRSKHQMQNDQLLFPGSTNGYDVKIKECGWVNSYALDADGCA